MSTNPPTPPTAPETLIAQLVAAFNAGDKSRCAALFAEDASIRFMTKAYRGRPSIEQWLEARFASGATILRVNGLQIETDVLTLRTSVTSLKLQAWRLAAVSGKAVLKLDEYGRIADCQLGLDGPLGRRSG